MKRSTINAVMAEADAFIGACGFHLPPFAHWTPAEWAEKDDDVFEIVDRRLGWDITDFGLGDFRRNGLVLFTIRNGTMADLRAGHGKVYAEKILVIEPDQAAPLHFHWTKMEDIINRGGGRLMVQLYNSTPDGGLADSDVTISADGVRRTVAAGDVVSLGPGESVSLPPGCYHKIWGAEGRVLVGEVSVVNDDLQDNRFHEELGRFPPIDEDAPPLYLLSQDYADRYRGAGASSG